MKEYKYLGDFSATPVWHSRFMECHDCQVSWNGCWDNFERPKCGNGELPTYNQFDLKGLDKKEEQ